eukprot:TRINITY_DN6879_c0_g1_i1.p1 TRINITY_DN6879_c0_g1~~TRINITY_DN6879_c0_g1_i1.p1  ORF type:complete len:142 (+),score=38.60 TRINITY_DN6879_c0_g1_i1:3-428(+)
MNNSKKQVLGTYKSLIKLARKWPIDENKKGRNMKDFLFLKIRENYRNNKDQNDKEIIDSLIEHANSEIESLNSIFEDSMRKQYGSQKAIDSISPLIMEHAKNEINTKSVQKTSKKKPTPKFMRPEKVPIEEEGGEKAPVKN